MQSQINYCIFFKGVLFPRNKVITKMLNSKFNLTWVLVCILSLFITSCGGGSGGGGGGSATPPPVNGNGNGGNSNGDGLEPRIDEATIMRQITELERQIATLKGIQDTNVDTIADLRSQITDLTNQLNINEDTTADLRRQIQEFQLSDGLIDKSLAFSGDNGGILFRTGKDDFDFSVGNYRYYIVELDEDATYSLVQLENPVSSSPSSCSTSGCQFAEFDQSSGLSELGIKQRFYQNQRFVDNPTAIVNDYFYQYQANISVSEDKINLALTTSQNETTQSSGNTDWVVFAGGVELRGLPIGIQTYKGITVSGKRMNYNGLPVVSTNTERLGISERPFTMEVDFGGGSGEIKSDTSTALIANRYDLEGDFTVDLTNGTFAVGTGDTLEIKRYSNDGEDLPAKIYGTFHGNAGEGVTGVFHDDVASPTIIGGIIGTKQ